MSWDSSIFGLIHVPLNWQGAEERNGATLAELPLDDRYPALSRSMFAATSASQSYRDQPIHYGATIKALPECWHEWVANFESLLHQMTWLSVSARLETEYIDNFDYWWAAVDRSPDKPVTNWERGGGPWTYDEFKRLRDDAERAGRPT